MGSTDLRAEVMFEVRWDGLQLMFEGFKRWDVVFIQYECIKLEDFICCFI